ncbi:MAG: hypothetical protein IID61_13690 [SAR324 cluster bacterium]|nr:hypothetical protein [SAR324 cluster bacterium]
MTNLSYIDLTQQWYQRKGQPNFYRYAKHEDGPFTRPIKPLAESRLVMISSAGIEIVLDDGPDPVPFKGINIGAKEKAEVFAIPSDTPKEKLRYITGAHNRRESDMLDIDAFFPVTRLRELVAEGVIGDLAANHLRIRPSYSRRKTRELDAPEVLRLCREQAVDVALCVPI